LLALGDHEFDGVNHTPALSQDSSADYGKTLLIDPVSGRSEHFTSGHRNPEGLVIDSSGTIWLSEHGPEGGDELNRLERGSDYGWPAATYGSQYGGAPWPLTQTPGGHAGFQRPAFAWVPSVGPTSLIVVQSDEVAAWKGDFLMTSLVGQSVWRMRVHENQVLLAEPIKIGHRIRDIAEGPGGRFLLWTDKGTILAVRPSRRHDDGQRVFRQCAGCHPIGNGTTHGIGPDMAGLFDREVAGSPGYSFSPALKRVGGKWTETPLTQFLRDPQAFAPGTTMVFDGIKDPNELAALVAFLKRN
jgi:cytochrome c2